LALSIQLRNVHMQRSLERGFPERFVKLH